MAHVFICNERACLLHCTQRMCALYNVCDHYTIYRIEWVKHRRNSRPKESRRYLYHPQKIGFSFQFSLIHQERYRLPSNCLLPFHISLSIQFGNVLGLFSFNKMKIEEAATKRMKLNATKFRIVFLFDSKWMLCLYQCLRTFCFHCSMLLLFVIACAAAASAAAVCVCVCFQCLH